MKSRKTISRIASTILLALAVQSFVLAQVLYTYSESMIELDSGVVGTVTLPSVNGKVPVVLMLHGFASQKDEVGDMYKRLAAKLATEKGIASLRIDFLGWGESAGDMADSTIQSQVDDAESAYAYLLSQDNFDASQIGVLGFSLGGGIAIVSGAQHPNWYQSMVIWSSVGDFYTDFLESLGQDNFDTASSEGIVNIDLGWRSISLKNSFFKSLKTYNLKDEIKNYSGAFLAIAGDQDFSAAYVDGFLEGLSTSTKEKMIIKGADHIYAVFSDNQGFVETVLSKTSDWFAKTLY